MRKTVFALIAILTILLVSAGCTSAPSSSESQSLISATPEAYTVPQTALPMKTILPLGNATTPFNVSIDSFEIKPNDDNTSSTITIYVAAKNTGKQQIKFVWFSELTDMNGNSFGGIGISHGGNGARTAWIPPNNTEMARDYVVVDNSEVTTLAKGAVLDVYFMQQQDNVTHSMVPDYHVTWVVDPGAILGYSAEPNQ